MTINEITNQIFASSVAGYFNHEKFTKAQLLNYIKQAFRPEMNTTRWAIEIALPDGWWLMEITRYSAASNGFDYFIPDTREQEQILWDRLVNRA